MPFLGCCCGSAPGSACQTRFGNALWRGWPKFKPRVFLDTWFANDGSGYWDGAGGPFNAGDLVFVSIAEGGNAFRFLRLFQARHLTTNAPLTIDGTGHINPFPYNTTDWVETLIIPPTVPGAVTDFRVAMNTAAHDTGCLPNADFRFWYVTTQRIIGGIYTSLTGTTTLEVLLGSAPGGFLPGTSQFTMSGGPPGSNIGCSAPSGPFTNPYPARGISFDAPYITAVTETETMLSYESQFNDSNVNIWKVTNSVELGGFVDEATMLAAVTFGPWGPCQGPPPPCPADFSSAGIDSVAYNLIGVASKQEFRECTR